MLSYNINLIASSHTQVMNKQQTMDCFLRSIEHKALHMAKLSTNGHADALDMVQDSMIKLVTRYQDKPPEQWKPLFYRILQNRLTDWHRHRKVKQLLFFWQSPNQANENNQHDLVEQYSTDETVEQQQAVEQQQQAVLLALEQLSEKQRQCFLLRTWEGLSVNETADIVNCSPSSVKTHHARAVEKIRQYLLEHDHDVTF